MKIILDENHKYFVDGVSRPGYSEILESLGFPKNPFWTESARAEGTAIHQWLLVLAKGLTTENEPDSRIAGRVAGISKFLREHNFVFVGGETPLYSQSLGYCCTPDLWGTLDGVHAVIEAKRGAKMIRHRLQTAAQKIALEDNGFIIHNRFCLYLKEGDYALDFHDDDDDLEAWRGVVAGYWAKERYK